MALILKPADAGFSHKVTHQDVNLGHGSFVEALDQALGDARVFCHLLDEFGVPDAESQPVRQLLSHPPAAASKLARDCHDMPAIFGRRPGFFIGENV